MRTGTTDLKPCPFCGGGKDSHEDWCFILMCLVNEEQAMFGNKRLFTEEELSNAWNTRAERTCENSETNLSDTFFKCSACGAYSYSFLRHKDGTMDSTRYCPHCGARVVGD